MKKNLAIYITALTLLVALAVPVQLAAQDTQGNNAKHHHYQLVQIPTLGGAGTNFFDNTNNIAVLNDRGSVSGGCAGTLLSDPYSSAYWWSSDGTVCHAFVWKSGSLTDLGSLPGTNNSGSAWISSNGISAGLSENGQIDPSIPGLPELTAVMWRDGKITNLGTLPGGGYQSAAVSVNNRGEVAGVASNLVPDANSLLNNNPNLWFGVGYGYQLRAFVWDQKSGMQDLGTLGSGTDAQAIKINERGQVIGDSYTSPAPGACFSVTSGAFIWDRKHGMLDLGSFGGTCIEAQDLNNSGQVVGGAFVVGDTYQRAFIWQNGSLRDLGGSLGGSNTGAIAVSENGEAVGFGYLAGETTFHATLWKQVGQMTDLGTVASDPCSFAQGVNDESQVVGDSSPNCNFDFSRAFLWEQDSMVDLNTLVPPNSPLQLIYAYTINHRGEIAANGIDANGIEQAALLIPCDEKHPAVEGCDYNLVDEAAARISSAPAMQRPTNAVRQLLPQRLGFGRSAESPQKAALNGKAAIAAPIATLSPASLAFSAQVLGTTSPAKTVTLKNTGTATLTIAAVAITGTDAGDFAQTHTCGSSLAPGASCGIRVTFKPTASGTRMADLSVTDNAAGSPQHAPLSGIGTTAKLSSTSLSFGTVAIGTASPVKTVTLTNVGTTTLTITAIAITGTNAGDFAQTHTCGSSLAAGASCTISVAFKPTQIGKRTGALSVADNAPGSPQTVSLNGMGTDVELSPTSLEFACIPEPIGHCSCFPSGTTTLTNVGSTTLSISDVAISGPFTQTNTCGASVTANHSCSINVTWSRSPGSGAVSISDNGGSSPQTVSLEGIDACRR